LLGYILTRM